MEIQRKGIGGHTGGSTNICFDCTKACGGCSWTEINPDTKHPRFEPVPGWTAKKVLLNVGSHKGGRVVIETYHITKCPQFTKDRPRKDTNKMLTEAQSKHFLNNLNSYLRRWHDE